jgi:hypothetical protein
MARSKKFTFIQQDDMREPVRAVGDRVRARPRRAASWAIFDGFHPKLLDTVSGY